MQTLVDALCLKTQVKLSLTILKFLNNLVHSFAWESSVTLCCVGAWGLKLEHSSVFLPSLHYNDLTNQSSLKQNSEPNFTVLYLLMFSMWLRKWHWACMVILATHSCLEAERGEASLLWRQRCDEEAFTLPARNYKISTWVASKTWCVCVWVGVWTLNYSVAHGMTPAAHFLPPLSLSAQHHTLCFCMTTASFVVQMLCTSSGLSQESSDIFKDSDVSKLTWENLGL